MAEPGPFQLLIEPPLGWAFAILFGALWGSFFNVAIHRLARDDARLRDVMWPPSHCPRCHTPIRPRDNLPIFGWLILGARCRDCGLPIPVRYPLVEALGGLLGGLVYYYFVLGVPDSVAAMYGRYFVYFFFSGTLLVLAFIDADTMMLPEVITLPAIPAFFVLGRLVHDVPWLDAVIGAAVGFAALKAVQIGYAMLRGREGLGGGDATLMALIGGFLGWRALPFTLGVGSIIGSMVVIPLLLVRRRRAKAASAHAAMQHDGSLGLVEVPFGPFLVAGALCYLFFGDLFARLPLLLSDAIERLISGPLQ